MNHPLIYNPSLHQHLPAKSKNQLTCPSYCRPRPGCPPSHGTLQAWQDPQHQLRPGNCHQTSPDAKTWNFFFKIEQPAVAWCRQILDFHPARGNSSCPPVPMVEITLEKSLFDFQLNLLNVGLTSSPLFLPMVSRQLWLASFLISPKKK